MTRPEVIAEVNAITRRIQESTARLQQLTARKSPPMIGVSASQAHLVKELARHLAILNGETEDDAPLYLVTAQETLRQMEWARREKYMSLIIHDEKATGKPGELVPCEEVWPDLTLAPPDWKP